MGSVIVVHRFHCSATCGNFLDQGLTLYHLHLQADSYPLCCQESPIFVYFMENTLYLTSIYQKLKFWVKMYASSKC